MWSPPFSPLVVMQYVATEASRRSTSHIELLYNIIRLDSGMLIFFLAFLENLSTFSTGLLQFDNTVIADGGRL